MLNIDQEQEKAIPFSLSTWNNVKPVPQDDGPSPVVTILYKSDYQLAMDYFRAISISGEKSQRVLDLTSYIISYNPAHYTVWKYRADCLEYMKADYSKEMEWLNELSINQPKSYQIWRHRQVIMEQLKNLTSEKLFLNAMLGEDSKNYHLWTYRQWLLTRFGHSHGLWDDELQDINSFLEEDVRNNSAWMHRYFYFVNRLEGFTEVDFEEELEYVVTKIGLAPRNESPWSYARGIANFCKKSLDNLPSLVNMAKVYVQSNIPQAMLYMLDICHIRMNDGDPLAKELASKMLELLVQYDPVRKQYWKYKQLDLSR